MNNIHATLVSYQGKGILFTGKSGSGKSDIALRMISEKGAVLVADDRVDLEIIENKLYGSAPKQIAGKLDIRGVGIASMPVKEKEEISLCVELCSDRKEIERLPETQFVDFLGISVEKIRLYPFDCSTLCKIIAKICGIIS